jgi:hypothetical protein
MEARMRSLAALALLAAACGPASSGDFEFDDDAFEDEVVEGCGGGKCDGAGGWGGARLGARGPVPETVAGGWTPEMVDRFNHEDQGVMFIPYSWILALERADSEEPFLTPDSVARWGLLTSRANDAWNPDGLPIGVTVHERAGRRYMGFTCAGCHTAEISVGGKTLRFIGGQGRQDMLGFGSGIATTFGKNLLSPRKAYRLIKRILAYEGRENTLTVAHEIYDTLVEFGKNGWHSIGLYPVTAGPGRLDALGKGGNRAFGQFVDSDNYQEAVANVSFPPLWDSARIDWTNYNGSIRQALARNTVEALGVGAMMVLRDGEGELFDSSVRFEALVWLEDALRALESPVWPATFGAVDQTLVTRGQGLYDAHCGGCHGERDAVAPNRIVPFPSAVGEVEGIGVKFFALGDIGTDPNAALAFADRTVVLSPALYRVLGIAPGTRIPAWQAFAAATSAIIDKWYQKRGFTAAERDALEHGRKNDWQAIKAYRARPLNGIWSTAPFLHNGSVPNLFELLGPPERRSDVFYVGSNELDPSTLGFQGGPFRYDTSLPGNDNGGHWFSSAFDESRPFTAQNGVVGPALDDSEIRALVEFLKVIEPLPR